IGHRSVPKRAKKPAFAVHGQIACRPYRGQPYIAGEDGVLRRLLANRLGDLLRMDRSASTHRQIIEGLARVRVVLTSLRKMCGVAVLPQQRQQSPERGLHVADDAKVNQGTAPDLLRAQIDLSDAHSVSLRIELAIWKIGAEH